MCDESKCVGFPKPKTVIIKAVFLADKIPPSDRP